MTKEAIAEALKSEGVNATNQGYAVPESREAVCLIGAPGDVFSVDRLTRIELREACVVLENTKRERFYFAYDDVLGLRILAGPAARERGAGFAR